MFESVIRSPYKGLLVIAFLIVASIPFQKRVEDIRGKFRVVEESLYFSSASLKRFSLGYEELLADIYWLRAIQYFGGRSVEERDPELLYHYFDIITDLDPKFVNAYRYGGTFLAEPPPLGLGDIERGIKLFDKGRKNNPENFRLPLEEAFIYYLYVKDYKRAAELFKEASEKPGLSEFRRASLRGMAASSLSKGGSRELARRIWEEIYRTTTIEGRKEFALRNLKELDAMDMEDLLTWALRRYIEIYGHAPSALSELKSKGLVKEIPKEPFGRGFVIVSGLNKVRSETLLEQELKYNTAYLSGVSRRFKRSFGRYPRDLEELKDFTRENGWDFPEHPLGKEYSYNPETGTVGE
ncbi:MAG: hypothetical protein KatS3mg078_1554 [Deltaproteobacteria bacterium]|nr:MAG: hypothetical protein KatS3mg078_1554 [Deltaproteobacteria bacterium]